MLVQASHGLPVMPELVECIWTWFGASLEMGNI